MDDYGTGSSSSQMMLELPVEGVKIDMFFVKDILEEKKKQALVIGMINFANAADLKICIEGIEMIALRAISGSSTSPAFRAITTLGLSVRMSL